MLFKWFRIKNFKSYGEDFYIDLSEWFSENDGKNLMLIWAKNWTWKSSFVEALNYLLYWFKNENWRQMSVSEIRDLITWDSPNRYSLSFQLDYLSDLWENFSIKRTWKDIGWLWDEKLELFLDWKPIDIAKDKLNNYINTIIPEWIAKFFFFTWEDVKVFTEEEEKYWLKKSIEAVLWITKFSDLIYKLNEIQKSYKPKTSSKSSKELSRLQDQLSEYIEESDRIDKRYQALKDVVSGLVVEEKKLQDKIAAIPVIPSLSGQIKNLELKKENLKLEQVNYLSKISQLKSELPLLLLRAHCDKIEEAMEHSREVNKARAFQWEIEKTIKALYQPEEIISHTKRKDEYYEIIYKKLSELHWEKYFAKNEFVLDLSRAEEIEVQNIISGLKLSRISKDWIIDLLSKYEEKWREIERIDKEVLKLRKENAELQVSSRTNEMNELTEQLKTISENKGIKWASLLNLWRQSVEIKNNIEKIKGDMKYIEENDKTEKERCRNYEKIWKYITFLEYYVKSLRNSEIENAQNLIESKYKKICHEDIQNVEIDKDTCEISVINSLWTVKKTTALWDAEKVLFALSIIWWLWRASWLDLPLIMDAPVASLDGIHKQNFLKIFLPEAGSQVILFSNTEHIDTKEDYASLKPYIYNEITLIKPIVSWESPRVEIVDKYCDD